MTYKTNPSPYLKSKLSTFKIMMILLISLLVVYVFAVIYSFKVEGLVNSFVLEYNAKVVEFNKVNKDDILANLVSAKEELSTVNYGLRSILMLLISLFTTCVCDVLTSILRYNKKSNITLLNKIKHDLIYNYSYISAIIFVLTLPVYTSYYALIIGSIFIVSIKNMFGGFGKNIFNPALTGRVMLALFFAQSLKMPDVLALSRVGIDSVSGATLTTAYNNNLSWLKTSLTYGYKTYYNQIFVDFSFKDILLGNYLGAMGETFTLLLFIIGIVLIVLKVINWRTPVFYLLTIALTSLSIALICNFDSPFSYVFYHLALGGVMFGAVFMLTDPVTGPTSAYGKILAAIFAGFITVLIRIKGAYPEGVAFSILLANFISPAIDHFINKKNNSCIVKKSCILASLLLISVLINTSIAFNINGQEVYSINGIDKPVYELLNDTLTLNDSQYYKKIDYQSKTDKLVNYKVSDTTTLNKAYEIVNSNNEKIAIAYIISYPTSINIKGNDKELTSTLMIAINNDGSIYGIGRFSLINIGNYKTSELDDYLKNSFTNKNIDNYNDVDNITSATYSSKYIKELISYAYEEFNMKGGN